MAALGNVSPVGLHQRAYGTFTRDLTIALTGASTIVQAGVVVVSLVTGVRDISLIGLAMPERAFAPKGVGDVSVSLTGASIAAQAQQIVGADATIYIDGGAVFSRAGAFFRIVWPFAFRVTMHSNVVAMAVKLIDSVGFRTFITDTIAALTNMTFTFFARTTIKPPVFTGITIMVDHVGFRTKITDYLAATVRTPGVD